MKIEWFYCVTSIKIVGEARARRVPIDPDGPRGLKFEGVLSPEPHALCPGLRLSSYLPSWLLFIVSKVTYTGSSTIVYRIERYEFSWSKLLLMN